MSKCPECNTKLRKFNGGLICQSNHKFSPGSKAYEEILNLQINPELNKKLCPLCQTPEISRCMCKISERRCINNHVWCPEYYRGDKRYFCEHPPDDTSHIFNF